MKEYPIYTSGSNYNSFAHYTNIFIHLEVKRWLIVCKYTYRGRFSNVNAMIQLCINEIHNSWWLAKSVKNFCQITSHFKECETQALRKEQYAKIKRTN